MPLASLPALDVNLHNPSTPSNLQTQPAPEPLPEPEPSCPRWQLRSYPVANDGGPFMLYYKNGELAEGDNAGVTLVRCTLLCYSDMATHAPIMK